MRLSQVCIDRPVLSLAMSLVILVFGVISLGRLPNRELPDVDPPVVSVVTVLPGAAPEVVETSVTDALEDELIGIEGIKHITSLSREESSLISVEFELSRDVDLAAADVRDRVARVRKRLPEEVEDPIVAKADFDAYPVMWLDLSGGGLSQLELSTLAETRLVDRFAKLPGVANTVLDGERRHAVRLWIDQHRLTARGLVVSDVAEALRRENVDIPSGRIESLDREFTVRTPGELRTAEEYAALILANVDGRPVRVRDVGYAEVGPEHERSIVRVNGVEAVGLGVVKQSKANTLDVSRAVKAEVEAIRPELPEGVILDVPYDSSIYIERSVRDVTMSIFHAVLLVLVVIFVFLRSPRATIIPAVSIPISIVGCLAFLDFLGFSINTLTLMGLTLAIGLVVDDAIVVLENITRWIEQGVPRMEAARRGMDEITFAVIAATVTAIAVFLPLSFLGDATGRLFREFGITVASAVAISGFVALTLSPALCARILRPAAGGSALSDGLRRAVEAVRDGYGGLLDRTLRRPRTTLLAGAVWVALGFVLLALIGRELVPVADRGTILSFTRAPEGSSLAYTDHYQRQVEEIFAALPEVQSSYSNVGVGWDTPPVVSEGLLYTALVPWEERRRSQQEIVEALYSELSQIPGIEAFPTNEPTLGQDFGSAPVSLVIQGRDIRRVAAHADAVVQRARAIPGLLNLQSDLKLNKPQLLVQIDRERASDLRVSVREIATTLQILLGGHDLSRFRMQGETYDVIAQLERPQRSNPSDLYGLYVRSDSDRLVSLDSLVTIEETIAPPGLPHFDRLRAATVTGHLAAGKPLGEALEQMREIAEDVIAGDAGYRIAFSGQSEQFYESGNALLFAYLLAVVLIYLVLAAQFESFVDPATILVAAALSFTGALLALWGTGHTLNLFSQIGLVMLVGLVTKNSILIVEFANQLRGRGATPLEAVRSAALIRFRPVLMTALSTMAGIVPIALGLGAGGEARAPLGVAVMGGMAFSTLLTFFVVPAVYLGFAGLERRVAPKVSHAPTAITLESG